MKLHLHEWGQGERLALLVHGIMADHRTFARTGPALAARGYRVLAVDLRGHGVTGPAAPYTLDAFADDLVDTLPAGAELALGHSLGGLALSRAVERLAPVRAVYEDPAWLAPGPSPLDGVDLAQLRLARREQIVAANPRWTAEDVDIELDTLRLWDTATAEFLAPLQAADLLPAHPVVPSLVVLADGSHVVAPDRAALLAERGFEVRTVHGAGHVIHRDDFGGFLKALDGWI
ncbi:alpha/beta fold hydrolase [Streptomyces iconiensis]|uniref:Alpha/beta fold hydrolase n=1 Tax=Streptomyces iconiensis TaxID=1384038 RepID=A0ABT7AAZ7_9ACTN|nr:alpha/beta fold hydrolase [Streptomyces iconiensis]MDJ1138526.1 alpha/beta fold hydrolase [Streptomyces iconiensis]